MSVRIHFSIDGVEAINGVLSRLELNAKDMRPAWDDIANDFQALMQRQFQSEGSALGNRWASLSPAYKREKERNFPGRKILERSGMLEKTLTNQPFGIDVREPSSMILGTAEQTGRWHQDGAGRLPKREIIILRPVTRIKWRKIIQAHLMNAEYRGQRIRVRPGRSAT